MLVVKLVSTQTELQEILQLQQANTISFQAKEIYCTRILNYFFDLNNHSSMEKNIRNSDS